MQGGEIYVPKIPSMRVTDLVEAVAPGCRIVETGIRPGEKLHEVMIPADDAVRTLEFDSHYVITPALNYWKDTNHKDGRAVPERFQYSSETNTRWLSVDEMRGLLRKLGYDLKFSMATA